MRSKHCIVVALIASLAVAAEDGAPVVDSLAPERGVRREKVEKFVKSRKSL